MPGTPTRRQRITVGVWIVVMMAVGVVMAWTELPLILMEIIILILAVPMGQSLKNYPVQPRGAWRRRWRERRRAR